MFKLLTILPFLAALVANSVAAPHRGGIGTKAAAGNTVAAGVAVGTQTITADASQSTPVGPSRIRWGCRGCQPTPVQRRGKWFRCEPCTNVVFFNSCFG
ncbi:hypothetical protein B0H14DRAFT_2931521, partial [Mycena olivaceomarginata]